MGGHLVSYGSSSEENDVVGYFTNSMGYLLAGNHSLYWLGLRSTVWPNFTWVDLSTDIGLYDNWWVPQLRSTNQSPDMLKAC